MGCTSDRPDRQPDGLLAVALGYAGRGWSVIPIQPGTKRPACYTWKRWQTDRPDRATLRRWFARGDVGLAVVLGPVSGGLVARDFDDLDAYRRWAADHADLAATLPTVETARGRHVYFLAGWSRILDLGDGELRGAGYCLLPPSRHPDGPEYRWSVPLPNGPIPRIDDLVGAGFLSSDKCNREYRDNGGAQRQQRTRKQ
ncbi:MAG: bifunctional DNA primase/polymerase [Pirellulales bacterium]|nr:bifunctional DNA primase/polymerase [Pirellulales bacterium]